MQMWDKKAIIKRLKSWRETNNLSTRKFALNAGIDPAHYAKVETGKMLVTESMLVKIFEKYSHLNKSHILYGTENNNSNAEQTAIKTVSAPVNGITALEVAAKIIGLAPPVNPDMPAAELYQHFVARENKYLLAYDLLKQTITELAAEVKMLKDKMDG